MDHGRQARGAQDGARALTVSRGALYGACSGVFAREVTRGGWAELCRADTRGLLRELARLCGVAAEAEAFVGAIDARCGDDPAAVADELAVDYARLFIGPGPGLAPPYESAYTTPNGRLFGEALSDVLATLRAEGVRVGDGFAAPADHIAVELSLMRHLGDRAAGPSGDAWRRQLEFLDRHLLRWVPRWAADVARGSATDFYRGAAAMLDAFLRCDRARVRRALGERDGAAHRKEPQA